MGIEEKKRTEKIDRAFYKIMAKFGDDHVLSVEDVLVQLCGYAAMLAVKVGMPRERFVTYVDTAWNVATRRGSGPEIKA